MRTFFLLFVLLPFLNLAQNAPIKVYLLGTFHFNQIEVSTYDVRQPAYQKDIVTITQRLYAAGIDKVFLESMPDFAIENRMDSFYQAFRQGDSLRVRNEIWQIGYRLAHWRQHERVYFCDHPGQYGNYLAQIRDYSEKHGELEKFEKGGPGVSFSIDRGLDDDSLRRQMSLLSYLQLLNDPVYQRMLHAHYISHYPILGHTDSYQYKNGEFLLGAELTADWYRRNIKIYSHILNQLDFNEKAIFLLIGNDHIPIIRQLFEDNPAFEVVPVRQWLGKSEFVDVLIKH